MRTESRKPFENGPHNIAGSEIASAEAEEIDIAEYQDISGSDKQVILNLLRRAAITNSEIGNRLNADEFLSAISQFCQISERLPDGRFKIVVRTRKLKHCYVGNQGNFLGAAFSFQNKVEKRLKWKEKKRTFYDD